MRDPSVIESSSYRKAGNFGSPVLSISGSSPCLNLALVLGIRVLSKGHSKDVFTYSSGFALNSAILSTGHNNLAVMTFSQPRQDLEMPGFATPMC